MIVISENLNIRNPQFVDAVRYRDSNSIAGIAKKLNEAGAEIINVQCSVDGNGDEETLPFVVDAVQKVSDFTLSLDTRNISALKRTVPFCSNTPLINYASAGETEQAFRIMEIASQYKTNLVLRAMRETVPNSLEAKMQILYDLIASANSADIPNGRLFADPSVVHIGLGLGQSHLVNIHSCVVVLKEMMEPPVRTIAWISNVSLGISETMRSGINSEFLAYLAGAGLDAAIIDVLDREMMKTAYLVKAFRDEIVFSPDDVYKLQ